jgi:carboxyl-terminal processing protease
MRRALTFLVLGGLLTGAFFLGFELLSQPRSASTAPGAPPSLVERVRAELGNRYYRPVPQKVLEQPTVEAMIAALHDPYTSYLDRDAYGVLRRELAASYTGIGVTLRPDRRGFSVVHVQAGPGAKAGLRVGDSIVRIGQTVTAGLGASGAISLMAGRPGTEVQLKVRRGKQLLRVAVRRAPVDTQTVTSHVVTFRHHDFAYLRVTSFAAGTARELAAQLRRAGNDEVSGYILDLRGNPGGLLGEAVRSASYFLRDGVAVVGLQGAHRPRQVYHASGTVIVPRLPLVVLVDQSSASSAEVLAAALHDDRRAVLIGQHTFGKAVVQALYPLGNGAAISLTTARYYTPSGYDISGRGIRPDVPVADNPRTRGDDVLSTALTTLGATHS